MAPRRSRRLLVLLGLPVEAASWHVMVKCAVCLRARAKADRQWRFQIPSYFQRFLTPPNLLIQSFNRVLINENRPISVEKSLPLHDWKFEH